MPDETNTGAIRQALRERKRRLELERGGRLIAYLEREVWPKLPPGVRGRGISKEEEEETIGFGPDGV